MFCNKAVEYSEGQNCFLKIVVFSEVTVNSPNHEMILFKESLG